MAVGLRKIFHSYGGGGGFFKGKVVEIFQIDDFLPNYLKNCIITDLIILPLP